MHEVIRDGRVPDPQQESFYCFPAGKHAPHVRVVVDDFAPVEIRPIGREPVAIPAGPGLNRIFKPPDVGVLPRELEGQEQWSWPSQTWTKGQVSKSTLQPDSNMDRDRWN